jgi:hypothetical protein
MRIAQEEFDLRRIKIRPPGNGGNGGASVVAAF